MPNGDFCGELFLSRETAIILFFYKIDTETDAVVILSLIH